MNINTREKLSHFSSPPKRATHIMKFISYLSPPKCATHITKFHFIPHSPKLFLRITNCIVSYLDSVLGFRRAVRGGRQSQTGRGRQLGVDAHAMRLVLLVGGGR